ncbi:hypothetical protein UM91_13440 [Pseudomonas oryzihabitans]|nr:hypothetical protein UM91_13440 [Pseudomonas oryzihabitans]
MLQADGKPLRTHVSASEVGREVRGEPAKRKQKCLGRFHFKVELDSQLEGCGWQEKLHWQDLAAQHLIQVVKQADRKAASQLCSGQSKQLIELAQAHAAKRLNDVRIKPKEGHGQGTHRRTQTGVVAYRQAVTGIGEHTSCYRIGRKGDPMSKAKARQFLTQASLEAWPRPEQWQTRLHFEDESIREVQAYLRTKAVRPGSQKLVLTLQSGIVVFDRCELWTNSLSGGERHLGSKAER